MKKIFMIVAAVVGGLAVLAGVIVGAIFWFTGGAVEASNEFLALIAKERIEEAYQSTADGFRSQQDPATFAATVKESVSPVTSRRAGRTAKSRTTGPLWKGAARQPRWGPRYGRSRPVRPLRHRLHRVATDK